MYVCMYLAIKSVHKMLNSDIYNKDLLKKKK